MSGSFRIGSRKTFLALGLRKRVRLGTMALLLGAALPCPAEQASSLVAGALAVGDKMYTSQDYEHAVDEYLKVLEVDPANWHASYRVAMSYLAMYHPGSAHAEDLEHAEHSIEAFERLLTMKAPDRETAKRVREYYVAILNSADKTDKVIAFYEDLLEKDPQNALYMAMIATMYAKSGDFPNALKYYQMRTAVEHTNKEAWYTVGVLCWERVKNLGPTLSDEDRIQTIDIGLEAIEKALVLDQSYFDAIVYTGLLWRERADALSAQLDYRAAGKAFERAVEFQRRAEAIGKRRMEEAREPRMPEPVQRSEGDEAP